MKGQTVETRHLRAAIHAADTIIRDAIDEGRRPDPVEAVREAHAAIFGTGIDEREREGRQHLPDAADAATDLANLMRRSFEAQMKAARRQAASDPRETEQGRTP